MDPIAANSKVLIVMGSASDDETMSAIKETLAEFAVEFDYRVASAHRSPEAVASLAKGAKEAGVKVIIAGAGGAAHLPGVVASFTTLPVIGVPIHTSALNGMDSLLSIVQMPGGVPVATMAIGKAGAKNAAIFAVQMLALSDPKLSEKLENYKIEQSRKALSAPLGKRS